MAVIDIKINPSKRDIKIFAALWAVFFVILAKIAFFTDAVIFKIAIATSVLFLISILFNRDFPKKLQLLGLIIPAVLWAMFWFEKLGAVHGPDWMARSHSWWFLTGTGAQWIVFALILAVAILGGLLIFASNAAGRVIYRTWMFAALPIGWTFSHVILGAAYYLVLTPIGLYLRLRGKDPMSRAFQPDAPTYWLPHTQTTDPARYFRQF